AFAADVQRYLKDEPVEACPPSALYKLRKFARRNKRGLGAAALFGTVLLAALATGIVLVRQEKVETDRQRAIAEEKAARLEERLYATNLRLAFRHWERGDLKGLDDLLAQYQPQPGKPDLRGFEWHYLDHLARMKPDIQSTFRDHEGDVYVALFSPDGKTLASAGKDGAVRLRDLGRGTSRLLGRHQDEVNFLI